MNWMPMLELLCWGLAAGVLGAVLGIGGGILFVLIIPGYLVSIGIPTTEVVSYTVANSLAATIFTTLSANFQQFRQPGFPWKEISWISAGGSLSSILLLRYFVNTSLYSKTAFQILFLGVILYMLIRMVAGLWNSKKESEPKPENALPAGKLSLIGLLSGCVSPLTGMGGGIVLVPILHSIFRIPIKKSQAVSLGVISITALVSSMYNLSGNPSFKPAVAHSGYLIFPLAGMLSLGGVTGATLGLKLASYMPERLSGLLFALFLLLILGIQLVTIFS
jgi:uncharacterized membrane protein YfcA